MRTWLGPDGASQRRRARSVIALAAISWGVLSANPVPPTSPVGVSRIALTAVCAVGWLIWLFQSERSGGPADVRSDGFGWPPAAEGIAAYAATGLIINGVAAVALSFVAPHSAALAFVGVAVVRAAHWWRPWWSAGFATGLALMYTIGHLVIGDSLSWLIAGPAVIVTALLLGLVRRQNDELAADAIAVREERARSSALDERARIAREIHDVLAHSLSALSVQLQTADALLESGRIEQGHEFVRRAGQLAREGIAETRRAIGALRGDTLPLPELLTVLAAVYTADLDARAGVEVDGEPRDLPADVSLTLYRTAQEAITNVRKHAPGAEVDVRLEYRPDLVALSVTNGPGGGDAPLAATGGGYGLTGLRERAELAGGTFRAAPAGGGWRVDVRIPA